MPLIEAMLKNKRLFIIKSREMMTSWLACGYIAWMVEWHPHMFWGPMVATYSPCPRGKTKSGFTIPRLFDGRGPHFCPRPSSATTQRLQ